MADQRYGTSTAEVGEAIRAAAREAATGGAEAPGVTGGSISNIGRNLAGILRWVTDMLSGISGSQADETNIEALVAVAESIVADIADRAGVTPAQVLDELSPQEVIALMEERGAFSSEQSRDRYSDNIRSALDDLAGDDDAGSPDALSARATERATRVRAAVDEVSPLGEMGEVYTDKERGNTETRERFLAKEAADIERGEARTARERVARARDEAFRRFAGLDRLVAGTDEQGNPIPQQFIGVPEGYFAERNIPGTLGTASTTALERLAPTYARDPRTGDQADFVPQAPLYAEGAQFDPAGWSVERRGRLQAELVRAGLLTEDFTWGAWDPSTMDAYSQLLGYANMTGVTDRAAARELQSLQSPDLTSAIAELRATEIADREAELPPLPDLASLRQTIRSQVAEYIGGDPTDEEMSIFLTALDSEYQTAREQERQLIAQQVDYDLAQGVDVPDQYQTGLYGSTTSPMEQALTAPSTERPVGPGRAVDPEARLAEQVRTRLAPQRRLLDSVASDSQQQSNIAQGVSRIFSRRRGA